ncbi:methyltransferase family protein [Paracraurococcus lichenis]|uniref:Isoprenylcysteine carboxylmethyltransferase family protein n=1 Tax=Paracraurococcus lichenis TaxID=3064888 RepID=A0ABT9DWD1_9PROT|nr:isoprenylcysteine carboxylmethyltransferase family protein [Paracraurococcus sp. LOR1-02]MDO9708207.1 isoprenylcysteine carboxylmethyltransferase family protein [Paracraurococcus sp. LOR1-02]
MPADHGPGIRVPPPVQVGLLLLLGWLLQRQVPVPLGRPLPTVGTGLMALGLALSVWTVVFMLRAGTDPQPHRPDQALVERGPFRLSRNPIYLGFLLVAAGFACRWGDLWPWLAAVGAFLVLDRLAVAREERYLRQRFGAAYEAYLLRVRRWI